MFACQPLVLNKSHYMSSAAVHFHMKVNMFFGFYFLSPCH